MKIIVTTLILFFSLPVFAHNVHKPIRVLDIGVMGLATHDLFQWNSESQENEENGRFDLSTIFDYADGERILQGGNPKNSENAPVFSVTQNLVSFYIGKKTTLLMSGEVTEAQAHSIARQMTIEFFLGMVKESYERFTNADFPNIAIAGNVNHEEQAAMRALHDILPGEITVNRNLTQEILQVTDFIEVMNQLSPAEMMQEVAFFDGEYDPAYLQIVIPGFSEPQIINLKESDQTFIEEQTDYRLEEMLWELHSYGKSPDSNTLIDFTSFGYHLENLFAKGICNQYADGSPNSWLTLAIECK